MQSQEEIKLEQAADEEGSTAPAESAGQTAPPIKKVGKKKASKKKSSKKKASKKKTSKKKAAKKKASKKKASKKKASKKKAAKKKASKKKLGKKKAGKKKASKKKVGKKKVGKKKTGKKKAGKKKRGKKKGRKKKGSKKRTTAAAGVPMTRLVAAVDELRAAVMELATKEVSHRRKAVDDFRQTAKAKMSDLESAAQSSLARLTGKS